MPKYTVATATPTGKVDPKFGTEFLVQFNEDGRVVKVSRQKPIAIGQEENGSIVDGQYGAYFKKDPFQPQGEGFVNTTDKKWSPVRKDNSDGMRQGMCINNAANYISGMDSSLTLDSASWAEAVHEYATALYRLGDLVAEAPAEAVELTPIAENPTVANVFGAVPANR